MVQRCQGELSALHPPRPLRAAGFRLQASGQSRGHVEERNREGTKKHVGRTKTSIGVSRVLPIDLQRDVRLLRRAFVPSFVLVEPSWFLSAPRQRDRPEA